MQSNKQLHMEQATDQSPDKQSTAQNTNISLNSGNDTTVKEWAGFQKRKQGSNTKRLNKARQQVDMEPTDILAPIGKNKAEY